MLIKIEFDFRIKLTKDYLYFFTNNNSNHPHHKTYQNLSKYYDKVCVFFLSINIEQG